MDESYHSCQSSFYNFVVINEIKLEYKMYNRVADIIINKYFFELKNKELDFS